MKKHVARQNFVYTVHPSLRTLAYEGRGEGIEWRGIEWRGIE